MQNRLFAKSIDCHACSAFGAMAGNVIAFVQMCHRHQIFLLLGAILYPGWGLFIRVADLNLPSYLMSRSVIGCLALCALAASFLSRFVRAHVQAVCFGFMLVLTAHYFYLLSLSGLSNPYAVGAFITVMAVAATLESHRFFAVYIIAVLLQASTLPSSPSDAFPKSAFLAGLATLLLVSFYAAHERIRLSRNERLAKDSLSRVNEKLEARVESRTAELMQAHSELKQSEARFRHVADAAPVMIWMADASRHCTYLNKGWLDFTGRNTEQNSNEGWLDNFHADDLLAIKERLVGHLQAGDDVSMEARLRRADGVMRWVSLTFAPRFVLEKVFAGTIGTCVDIHDRKRMENILRQSEAELRHLTEAMPQIVWTASAEGLVDYFNAQWSHYTGISPQETFGWGWIVAAHPDDKESTLALWQKALESGVSFSSEVRLRSIKGDYNWYLVRAVPVLSPQEGHILKWFGTCTNIEEQKRWHVELHKAKEAADAANNAKSEFLANVSHEIRTPLGAMLGFAELLLSPHQSAAEKRESVLTIKRNGELLSNVINDILDLSKIEANRLDVEFMWFSLDDVVREVQTLLGLQAQEKALLLTFVKHKGAPRAVYSDPTRLRQILLNIVGNAIKFTEKGHVIVEISTNHTIEASCNMLEFSVQDTGLGLSAEQKARLFQPFMQADASMTRRFGGTGLGLVLSRKLALLLGGDLWLQASDTNQGSVFVFSIDAGDEANETLTKGLPIRAAAEMSAAAAERQTIALSERSGLSADATAAAHPSPKELKGVRVLLADDAPDNRLLVKKFLTMAGAEVDFAENGVEAVEMGLGGPYDLILMDIQMPRLNGYEATGELRRKGFRQPIIALTAHALKEERERSLRAGCDDHVTKPINRNLLVERVAYFAGRQTSFLPL